MSITIMNLIVLVVISWVMFAIGTGVHGFGFAAGVTSACIAVFVMGQMNKHSQTSPTDEG